MSDVEPVKTGINPVGYLGRYYPRPKAFSPDRPQEEITGVALQPFLKIARRSQHHVAIFSNGIRTL